MSFRPDPVPPDMDRLKSSLLKSGIQADNNPLFQVITQLIDAVRRNQIITNNNITAAGGTGSVTEDYLTHSDESVALPNSRNLIAGTNITFNDATPNERTIAAVGSGDVVGPGSAVDGNIALFDGTTGKLIKDALEGILDTISQAEAEAGTATTRRIFTAERVKQAIEALAALPGETYITVDDESIPLPNSRRLLAGANITFNDVTPNERTISAAGGGGSEAGYWSPLVLSLGVGDSEMVISDTGAPFIIWIPTP